jgi:hypothetical protein
VAVIGATATAEHCEARQQPQQVAVLVAQFARVAGIQLFAFVELRVAAARRVGAQATDTLAPLTVVLEDVLEVRRMRAVDRVVGGLAVRLTIGAGDGVSQPFTRGQPPVGLDCE